MAPKVPKKPLKSMEKPVEKIISKKKKKKKYTSFSIYLYKLLRQVAKEENQGISRRSMLIMNNFIADMMEKLAVQAGRLTNYGKRNTMGSREIQTAVRLLIPGELGKHANMEGIKAIRSYHNDRSQRLAKRKDDS